MSGAVRYQVRHQTVYAYAGSVAHAQHLLHLEPRETATQRCLEQVIDVWPVAQRSHHVDAFGNRATRLELDRPHQNLEVTARMRIELLPKPAVDAAASMAWEQVRDGLHYTGEPIEAEWLEAARYRAQSPFVSIKRLFEQYAVGCFAPGTPVLIGAQALMGKIHQEFRYQSGATHIGISLLEVLAQRSGVCQDYAHFMIACLRSLGLAARYVSGYLHTTHDEHGPELMGADASHAWVAVFAPPFGWIELDPTNNLLVDREHVVLAWGRDFSDVSPLRGVLLGGGAHSLDVGVSVQPLPT